MIGIYKITAPDGKIYIGQSKNYNKRLQEHKNSVRFKSTFLKKSFDSFGFEAHKFEFIESCCSSMLNDRERYYQDLYDVCGTDGLNMVLTPTSSKPYYARPELLQLWSNKRLGKELSAHHLEAIRKEHARRKELGIFQITPELRRKMSLARVGKRKGIPLTTQHRESISKSLMGKPTNRLPENAMEVFNTQTGIFYSTVSEAAFSVGMTQSALSNNLNGKTHKKSDFIYSNASDDLLREIIDRRDSLGDKSANLSRPGRREGKTIVDLTMGIFYISIVEAARAINMKKTTLHAMLSGQLRNKTSFSYA